MTNLGKIYTDVGRKDGPRSEPLANGGELLADLGRGGDGDFENSSKGLRRRPPLGFRDA